MSLKLWSRQVLLSVVVSAIYLVHSSYLNVCETDLLGEMMCSVRENESYKLVKSLVRPQDDE